MIALAAAGELDGELARELALHLGSCAPCREEEAAVREVAADYEARTGRKADVFAGTSPGAYAFGPRRYRPGMGAAGE